LKIPFHPTPFLARLFRSLSIAHGLINFFAFILKYLKFGMGHQYGNRRSKRRRRKSDIICTSITEMNEEKKSEARQDKEREFKEFF